MIETVFDTLNAKAAIYSCLDYFEEIGQDYPLMICGVCVCVCVCVCVSASARVVPVRTHTAAA